MITTVVWGTGNVGRAAIRAVDAHPGLELAAVVVHDPAKVGRDAGDLAGLDRSLGVAATDRVDAVLAAGPGAVVYAASGDIRPDEALADVVRAVGSGAVVVTPALYALYDQGNAPPEVSGWASGCSAGWMSGWSAGCSLGWSSDCSADYSSG
jgi:hypothetical protein